MINFNQLGNSVNTLYDLVIDTLWEWKYLLLLILISGLPHAFNMFNYPYFENDEGVYLSQAWSVVEQGTLAPYTYWYDHAPAGWIFTAFISLFTGGIFTFGLSTYFGRLMMLAIHVLNSIMIYKLIYRYTKTRWAGFLAVVLFSFSPLGLYYHRRFLLDTIMMFWVLLTMVLIEGKKDLRLTLLSAITFGIAILTKESAVFLLPAFLIAIVFKYKNFYRWIQSTLWLAVTSIIVSFYPLFALLKNELFPDPTGNRVSLIGSLQYQLSRGQAYPFWSRQSSFWYNLQIWLEKDVLMIAIMVATLLLSFLLAFKYKNLRLVTALSISYLFFLLRGKLVIDFYIIPLITLVSLGFGLVAYFMYQKIPIVMRKGYLIAVFFLALTPSLQTLSPYTMDETKAHVQAIEWIRKNVKDDETIIIDASMWSDMRGVSENDYQQYANAEWFWKIETDPEVRDKKLEKDWRNVDYVVLSHEMVKQIADNNAAYLGEILDRSYLVQQWLPRSSTYIDITNRISTNGDWMAIYKVKDELDIVLEDSWQYYKDNFIVSYGQVIDPQGEQTTSEGQSYAMLRAVAMGDRGTFDGVWQWTQDHMQHRNEDSLISWLWKGDQTTGSITDPNSAIDADIDMALALIKASQQWESDEYLADAQELLNDIWNQTVIQVGDRYLLIAGTAHLVDDRYAIVNPSYFSPAWYRVFATVDPQRDWEKLADDSYYWLDRVEENGEKLPPNWVLVDIQTNTLSSAKPYVSGDTDLYGFDAFRTFWRVAYDYHWFATQEAYEYLGRHEAFFTNELEKRERVFSLYSVDGQPHVTYANPGMMSAPLAVLQVRDPEVARLAYFDTLDEKYQDGYWGASNHYYDQNWSWFTAMLIADALEKPEILRN